MPWPKAEQAFGGKDVADAPRFLFANSPRIDIDAGNISGMTERHRRSVVFLSVPQRIRRAEQPSVWSREADFVTMVRNPCADAGLTFLDIRFMAFTTSSDGDVLVTARQVGLRYVSDDVPGITRESGKDGFRYRDAGGRLIRDEETLARIKSLVVPPAWTDVWICPWDNGHIQATGRDAKRRKQYRYHTRWRKVRDEAKYGRMINFGKVLPLIRRKVDEALKLPGLPREKVLATIVYLLQATMMRIGNEEYARQNKSFGLTTLRDRHVRIDGREVEFQFRGKSGVRHTIRVDDPRLARIIKRTRDLPGQELFQYIDDDGAQRTVDSADVNDYLRSLTGEDYTAKDFRTWSGTMLAALALQEYEKFDSEAQAKKNVVRAIEAVAEKLGNTPSICRKCYVHPAVIESYLDGTMLHALQQRAQEELVNDIHALSAEEAAVVALLQQRLQNEPAASAKSRKSSRGGKSRKKQTRSEARAG